MKKWVEVVDGKVVAVRTNTINANVPPSWREVTDRAEDIGPGSVHGRTSRHLRPTYGRSASGRFPVSE